MIESTVDRQAEHDGSCTVARFHKQSRKRIDLIGYSKLPHHEQGEWPTRSGHRVVKWRLSIVLDMRSAGLMVDF